MSGSRQHFLPRFLQKRFATKRKKDFYVWLNRRDGYSYNANIVNVGVGKDYYKVDEALEADSAMDSFESKYAGILARICNGELVPSIETAEFLAHLEVRTANLRCNFEDISSELVAYIEHSLGNPSVLESILSRVLTLDSPYFLSALKGQCQESGLDYEVVTQLLKRNPNILDAALSNIIPHMALQVKAAGGVFQEALKSTAKKAHVKVLTQTMAPDLKVNLLSSLKYFVALCGADLPLGDSAVLFQVDGDRSFKSFLEKGDNLVAVYLPISSRELLIGLAEGCELPDLSVLPIEFVKASRDFFITNNPVSEQNGWHSKIGSNAYILNPGLAHEMISEAMMAAVAGGGKSL